MKLFLKKYCCGLVEGVDLVFRTVCQISGQDNVSYCRNDCFNKGFVGNRNFNNCAALPSDNSTNSLKLEPRTKQSCKVLIVKF